MRVLSLLCEPSDHVRECFFHSSLVFISWDWKTKGKRELRQREGGKGTRAKKVKWKARREQMWFHGATQTPHVVLVNWKQRFAPCLASPPLQIRDTASLDVVSNDVGTLKALHWHVFAQKWKIRVIV